MTDEAEKDPLLKDSEEQVEEPEQKEEPEAPASLSPEETRAQSWGWKPKEVWVEEGGNPDEWVPAKHFLKFGELKTQLVSKDKELAKAQKLQKMMKIHHLNVREQAYKDAVLALKVQRRTALENNDLTAAEAIRDQIDEEKERFEAAKVLPPEIVQVEQEKQVQEYTPPPEFYDFLGRNPWYVQDASKQDEMSKEADKIGIGEMESARLRGEQVPLTQLYKTVEVKIRKLYPEKFSTPKSPQSKAPEKNDGKTGTGVKLSDEELQVAKAFGLKPEDYAKQVKTYRGR